MGLVAYCILMTVTTFKHAGAHQPDLSPSEVHQALYVSSFSPIDQWQVLILRLSGLMSLRLCTHLLSFAQRSRSYCSTAVSSRHNIGALSTKPFELS